MKQMEKRIYKALKNRSGFSFVDLENRVEGFKGDQALTINTNVYLWANVSKSALEAINVLVSLKIIAFRPCSVLVYYADGCSLNMPIAKSAAYITKGYKKPHWLPVVFSGIKDLKNE